MFDTVILLTGPAERDVLASVLKSHNAKLAVHQATTRADLDAIDIPLMQRARLIGFLTSVMVPIRMVERLGFGAYNFHPGPPNYPGWLPTHFASYDKVTEYGATAHAMAATPDSGAIVGVEMFPVPPDTGVIELEKLAFTALARLFWRLAKPLAKQSEALPQLPLRWRGRRTTRQSFAAMCDIPLNISKDDLDRRVPVFGLGHCGLDLTVNLHGYQFRYVPAAGKTEAPSIAPSAPAQTEKV